MIELFHESIRTVNLPYTVLFGLSAFYWILYLVGVFGSDLLDFDFGGHDGGGGLDVHGGGVHDVGADFAHDIAADAGHGAGHDVGHDLGHDAGHGGWGLSAIMRFVYAAEVPVTVVASTMSLTMWVISILTNYYTNNTNLLVAGVLAVPIFIGGLISTKIVLMPFVPLLKRAFDESSDVIHVIGQLCVVTSLEVTERHGQVEVPLKGSPLLLNVKTREGITLKKGDEAVVFGREDDGTYIIAPFSGNENKIADLEV